jgi:small-conductance mechanosensitive channel
MDSLHEFARVVGRVVDNIWSCNLVTVSGNHIRISNIILAILLVLAGMRYSKYFTNAVKRYIKTKIDYDKDAANALEKLILYIALCLYIITILEISNIPLSIFAFIGGALAIALGLGTQTLISNFISSLTIMLERPLKIGDIVEIDGITGTVNSVGARCVILTTFSNIDVLIPNSKLMQNTIANWMLNDNAIKYRAIVRIPKRSAMDPLLLIKGFKEIIEDLKSAPQFPNAEVYLTEVEKEELGFSLNFYSDLTMLQDPEYIKGKLNLAILKLLKDSDFTIEYLKNIEIQPTYEKCEK